MRRTLGATLLEPTRIYVKPVLALLAEFDVRGMAHITGGGLTENTHRMFPAGLRAHVDSASWARPAIFDWLQHTGNVAAAEMHRVFNCGIGMVLVVPATVATAVVARLGQLGETACVIGTVERNTGAAPDTVVV